jgi:hypothetical protein
MEILELIFWLSLGLVWKLVEPESPKSIKTFILYQGGHSQISEGSFK